MTHLARTSLSTLRPAIDVHLGESATPAESPLWNIGGFLVQFVRLGPGESHALDHTAGTVYVKVVCGRLDDLGRGAYAPPYQVRNTRVTAPRVTAGSKGAVFTIFTATPTVPDKLEAMGQLTIAGPHAELLQWESFEAKYGAFLTAFNGLDTHLIPGFRLLDVGGAEIAYLFVWTAGKGVDMTTHNHGNAPRAAAPAFAEVHWVMHNGTGSGGMYRTPAPGAAERTRYPMQRGDEHGPFFDVDPATGHAVVLANGAVSYPWHGWEAGTDDRPGQAFDVIAAFEITAPYADTRA